MSLCREQAQRHKHQQYRLFVNMPPEHKARIPAERECGYEGAVGGYTPELEEEDQLNENGYDEGVDGLDVWENGEGCVTD